MTLQDINCFMKLAETLNYTKTAEELFISQPAVTRHINTLEDELKIKLFDRSIKRNISLTESGKLYLKGLRKCKNIYENTLNTIYNSALADPLMVNFLRGTRIPDDFVLAIENYMKENPSFKHFNNFIDSYNFSAAIEKGEIVICQSEYLPKDGRYKIVQLTDDPVPYFLLADKKHPGLSDPEAPDFQKIKDTTLFLPKDLPDPLKEKYLQQINKLLGGEPAEIMNLDSMDSVELFLRSGRCFTIVSGWSTQLDSKNTAAYEMDFASAYMAIWDPDKCLHPQVADFIKSLTPAARLSRSHNHPDLK
ncbi:MAG: LysR family transcriptional regulator [Lachnospiraceae bacterium]|nr:LysR family transcriptional regulator [Lachnospiraceae bacterium]